MLYQCRTSRFSGHSVFRLLQGFSFPMLFLGQQLGTETQAEPGQEDAWGIGYTGGQSVTRKKRRFSW
jgi:hypothetical protein